jgi:RNA polymerase sigma-70 factor (ECF subfamily)
MASLHWNADTGTEGSRPQGGRGNTAEAAPTALGQIEACIPSLRRYAAALVHQRDAADGLVRECIIRALDMLHSRNDDADVKTWLFAMMHNLFMSQSRRRRFSLPFGNRAVDEGDTADGRGSFHEDGHRQPELLQHLKHLPDEQRSAVLLISVEDLSYAEAATVLGMPAAMMMSCLARGRERLRQLANTKVVNTKYACASGAAGELDVHCC